MGLVKKLAVVTAVLVAGLGYLLYTPIPDGFSKPWTVHAPYSAAQLMKLLTCAGVTLGLGEEHQLIDSIFHFYTKAAVTSDDSLEIRNTHFDGIPVRLYYPKQRKAAKSAGFVYYHGGGWVVGSPYSHEKLLMRLAKKMDMLVVAVDYRLAPEHIFPAAFEDCVTATKYFLQNAADFGVDPRRIAIGGDSAGGHMGAVVSIKLRDEKFPLRNKLQVLLYPITQAVDLLTPSYQANADDPLQSKAWMGMFWSFYMQGHRRNEAAFLNNQHTSPALKKQLASGHMDVSQLPKGVVSSDYVPPETDYGNEKLFNELKHLLLNPYISPLLADDLSGLSEAYVFTAQNDVLRDEGIWYAQRLQKAGVKVTHRHSDIAFHSIFMQLDIVPEADELLDEIIEFLKTKL